MYKQLSGRNHRSKGIKVKHVLQIGVLLLICFWLLYQVKHSHDRKKELDRQDATVSLNTARKDGAMKLGRKDLNPQAKSTISKGEKHDEEAEEEDEKAGEEEENNNKHEKEEQADGNIEEKDDEEGRGAVDEDVDDPDQEKSDAENDREEEFIDDEKERENGDEQESEETDPEENKESEETDPEENKESEETDPEENKESEERDPEKNKGSEERDHEENNGQTDSDSGVQDQDHEGAARSTHEAREENYKADDASSAVTHDAEMTTPDNETVILDMSNSTEESQENKNTVGKGEEGETTLTNEASTINSSNPNETRGSDNEMADNSTQMIRETPVLSLMNENGTTSSESANVQSIRVGGESAADVNNSKISSEDSHHDFSSTTNEELPKLSVDSVSSTPSTNSSLSAEAENGSGSSVLESDAAAQGTKDEETGVENEGLDESTTEVSVELPHDPIDSSDSSISLEEKDVRNDLETLPEIQTEGSNSEDAVAE